VARDKQPMGDSRRTLSRIPPPGAPPFRWPLESGVVSSAFGRRWGKYHDGIDIAAPVGSPVRAAAAGRVVFDQSLSGYGKVIILFHGKGFSTVYAHNDEHYVRRGQKVRAGQRIAAVGHSGRTTGPNLHFEVRHDNIAHDPMLFLPASGRAAVAASLTNP
jgi:lipoprotein NlpD